MKQLYLHVLTVLLLLPLQLRAHDFETVNNLGDTLYYKILTDTTCALTYKGTSYYSFDEYKDTIVVPSTAINPADGKVRRVTNLGYNTFRGSSVKHVVLPDGLTTIDGAITGADSLKYIYVPSTLTTIEDGYLTSNLKNLEVLEWNARQYVNTTGKSLFQNTSVLSSYIGLRKIIFGPDVEIIPTNFCRSLSSLHTVVIPSNVSAIGADAFYDCGNLYEIYNQSMIPLEIGSTNFGNIASKAKIIHHSLDEPSIFSYLPEWHLYLLNDELHVFRYVGTSYEVNMPQSFTINNKEYKRYNIDGSTFYGGPASERVTSLTLPDSIAVLHGSALSHTRITSITIPRALQKIDTGVFPTTLTSVTWNAIAPYTINNLSVSPIIPTNVSSIVFGQDVRIIPSNFLVGNKQLTTLSLPDGIEEIGNNAFKDCNTLMGALTLPENLRSIGTSAFQGCTGFYGTLKLPEGLRVIGENAFQGCTGFYGQLTIPDSISIIGIKAFSNISFTGILTIPEALDTLGASAFGAAGFTTIHYNARNCTTLQESQRDEKSPFLDCSQLTSVILGDKVEVIPDYLCNGLTNLITPIEIPSTLKYIGTYAFNNAGISVGSTLVFPEELEYVGAYAINADNIDLLIIKSQKLNFSITDRKPYRPNWHSGELKAAIHLTASIDSLSEYLLSEEDLVDSIYYDIPYPLLVTEESWNAEDETTAYEYIPYQFSSSWKNVSKIGIGPSVRDIPSNLFQQLSNVKQVFIPMTVENLGCEAFAIGTEVITEKSYGPTIKLNGTSVETWKDVYVYAETMEWFSHTNGEITSTDVLRPFGERPGKLLESPYELSFPLDYCKGFKIEFSNGTDKSELVALPQTSDTVFCSLMMQTGTEIPIIFGKTEDLLPEPALKTIVLDDNEYQETFQNNSMGDFTEFVKVKPSSLPAIWTPDNKFVKASAYLDGNTISEAWLVSPEFDCSHIEFLYLSFEHSLGYTESITDITNYIGLKITTDGSTWTDVPITTYPIWGTNINQWMYVQCMVDLSQYLSESTRFAFVYKSDLQHTPTWEIMNLTTHTTEQVIPDEEFGTMQVPIARTTKLADLFYDVDGDSIMEYVYLNEKEDFIHIYTYKGQLKDYFSVPSDMKLTAIDDIDRNGITDFILYRDNYDADDHQQVYIMPYDTKTIRPLSDAKYNSYNVLFDANGDGRTDYYTDIEDNNNAADYIYIQQTDGSFVRKTIQVVTDENEIINEAFAQSEANIVLPPPVHFGGASLAKAPAFRKVEGMQKAAQMSTPTYSNNSPLTVDINRDGMPDLLNLYNENSLISLGEGRYYYGTLFGQVTVGDYNSDDIQDFIIFDPTTKTVYLYLYEGDNVFSKQILMQNMNISQVHTVDLDNDGDLDIVLAFDWTEESQYAMLVTYRNDAGTFTKFEHAFGQNRKIQFYDLADVDGDGIYEIVCGEGGGYAPDNRPAAKYFLTECTPYFTVEEEEPFHYCKTNNLDDTNPWSDKTPDFIMGDMNNDGYMEYWISNMHYVNDNYQGGTIDWWSIYPYCGRFERKLANTKPAAMEAPTYIFDAASGMLKVEWQPGNDAESSVCDLTYSVRVGTQPGLSNIMYGLASASGCRQRLGEGNIGTGQFTIFDIRNWNKGTYYIAVQAIDKEGLAGPWSDELVFEHNMLYAAFEMDHSRIFTSDTLTLKLSNGYDPQLTYDWTLGDNATIVEENNGTWKVVFNRTEEMDIQLRVSDTDGSYADASPHHLVVMPLSWQEDYYESSEENEIRSSSGTYFDVDLNGTLDVVGSISTGYTSTTGLHTNDGSNRFTKVPRSFNLDLDPQYTLLTDYDMDGYADFYSTSSKGDVFINSGANCDFTYYTKGLGFVDNWNNGAGYLTNMIYQADINMDGYLDMIDDNNKLWVNAGDNLTFNKYDLPALANGQEYTIDDWLDWDADGRLDAIIRTSLYQQNTILYWFRNLGNNNFATAQQITQLPYNVSLSAIADLDDDGYKDIVYSKDDNETRQLFILWGNADGIYTETCYDFENNRNLIKSSLIDMDNNGYLDIVFSENVLYQISNRNFIHISTNDDQHLAWSTDDNGPFADLNGDTRPDRGNYLMSSLITNTSPTAPKNVKAVQDDGYVVLSWDEAYDAETPYHAMRYNVSVKKAGASGAGSYIISPMNGGSDIAAIAPQQYYYTVNRLEIPANRFTVGESYEVKVQSIDGWNAHSPFSETFTITITSEVSINAPSEACTGTPVTATYFGTESGTPQWNSEGATVTMNGNSADFTWTTPGVKTIECTINGITSTRAITITQGPDMSFTLPDKVLSSAYVYFTLPQAFADSRNHITYRHSYNPEQEQAPLIPLGNSWIGQPVVNTDKQSIEIERRGNSLDARMIANVPDGNYWIEFVCLTGSCGEVVYRQNFTVEGDNVTPEISIVTIDATTGKNVINWQQPSNLPNDELYSSVVIYREEGATDNFVQLGEVAISDGRFVDMASEPSMRKYRYRIALKTIYGGISTPSAVHSSVHVMLNRGLTAGSINITWTPYEGGIIEQYTILKGSSPDKMQPLTTTSGYEQSYTDFGVTEGDVYYALSYTNTYDNHWGTVSASSGQQRVQSASKSPVNTGQSNVVNAKQSTSVTPATSLEIRHVESSLVINQAQQTVHLYTEIMPGSASYKTVNWQITSGNQLASVSSSGLVSYIGNGTNGTVTVRATTIDGSNLSQSVTIPVTGFSNTQEVTGVELSTNLSVLTPTQNTTVIQADVTPYDATDRSLTWTVASGANVVVVNQSGLVTALGVDGQAIIRATAKNGVYGEIAITVENFEEPVVPVTGFTLYTTDDPASTIMVNPILKPSLQTLYVKADIKPSNATNKEFALELLDGEDLVTVTKQGSYYVIKATASASDGIVYLKGKTVDGSNLTYSFEVILTGFNATTVQEVDSKGITVYPNPVQDILYIDSKYQINSIQIFSSNGKVVYISDDAVTAINLLHLPSGIYYMKIQTKEGLVLTKKIIVRK